MSCFVFLWSLHFTVMVIIIHIFPVTHYNCNCNRKAEKVEALFLTTEKIRIYFSSQVSESKVQKWKESMKKPANNTARRSAQFPEWMEAPHYQNVSSKMNPEQTISKTEVCNRLLTVVTWIHWIVVSEQTNSINNITLYSKAHLLFKGRWHCILLMWTLLVSKDT